MNIFHLSVMACPVIGAITGGACARSLGVIPAVCGVVLGLMIGLALWGTAICFSGLVIRVSGVMEKADKLRPVQWLASLGIVLILVAAPFATSALTSLIVTRFFHG